MFPFNDLKISKPSHHPWEKIVKDKYSTKIKYGHNSINNIQYPISNKKLPSKGRTKFTIIGNRVTKEFNYCINIAIGLYKYRWKDFDYPVIKGVTSVEWPRTLNDLKIQYGESAYCLNNQLAILINDKLLGGEKEFKELIETKYSYDFLLDYYKEGVGQFSKFINSSGRPCAFMHISINDEHTGTLIFMLYADLVPNTCENFLRLCATTKGGYSGTPIHRIVKDSWVQCGGFGLKGADLDCENFIVPHDRRGVLCMANDGRHVDCSTQFFILLQPAPWMAQKYVAFGQLIDGESTLKAVESVPTWYESPTSRIILYRTGILNLECQDIMINKGANEYIQGHIEDLFALGEILYEELMEKVFMVADLREKERLLKLEMEEISSEEKEEEEEEEMLNIRETKSPLYRNKHIDYRRVHRFIRKKEDMDNQRKTSQAGSRRATSQIESRHPPSVSHSISQYRSSTVHEEGQENNEFDVEVYEYEPEEYSYKQVSIGAASIIVKPEKPYYIALTDVPYPGDVDSTFDLKKMLRGDYCLESDLQVNTQSKVKMQHTSYISEMFRLDNSEQDSTASLDSDDQREIKQYLKQNVDRVSFAGNIVRSIARGVAKFNIFEDTRKSELITDEELRRFKIASAESRPQEEMDKKVSIAVPVDQKEHGKIKRRQTGFIRAEDLEKITLELKSNSAQDSPEEEESATAISKKVRIASSATASQTGSKANRKLSSFQKPIIKLSDTEITRQSALSRLYEDVEITYDDDEPTLKDYKPLSEVQPKYTLLTYSPNSCVKSDENTRERYLRRIPSDRSYEHALSFQHGKKFARKISSDYVKTIDQMQNRGESSIRSVEYAKTRPCISVSQYQLKNQKYYEQNKNETKIVTVMPPSPNFGRKKSSGGLR